MVLSILEREKFPLRVFWKKPMRYLCKGHKLLLIVYPGEGGRRGNQ